MKKSILALMVLPLMAVGIVPAQAAPAISTTEYQQHQQAELDSILAPVALYPDTLLTHIMIASTYPLQVVEADRWRQENLSLSERAIQRKTQDFDWDPSVKALLPFADVLQVMSQDLHWLGELGDWVLTDEALVLDRIQALRTQAWEAGNLADNAQQRIARDNNIIIVESRQPDVVYVPYYDPLSVYGHWHHAIQPVFWHRPRHIGFHTGVVFSPSVRISASFYFGNIFWPERHVVISRAPVRHYQRSHYIKRSHTREYQRWQHHADRRHVRYSNKVVSRHPNYANSAHHKALSHKGKTHKITGSKHQLHQRHQAKSASNPALHRDNKHKKAARHDNAPKAQHNGVRRGGETVHHNKKALPQRFADVRQERAKVKRSAPNNKYKPTKHQAVKRHSERHIAKQKTAPQRNSHYAKNNGPNPAKSHKHSAVKER